MQYLKNPGRIYGLLLLAGIITGATGTGLRGLSGAALETTAFLKSVVLNTANMKMAIGLDMLGSALGVLIAIFLLPIIKKTSQKLAFGYLGIAIINFAIITISNVVHVMLLAVAADFSVAEASVHPYYITMAKSLHGAYYWAHFLMLMLYGLGSILLYFFFVKSRLVPKWLAIWGILASAIVFTGGALQIADIPVSFYLFIQNGVFVLFFMFWMLVKGFNIKES